MDDAIVVWLNRMATSSPRARRVVGGAARWLAGVEIALMLLLGLSGRRRSAARMLVAVGAVYAVSEGLGLVWRRERPFVRLGEAESLTTHAEGRSFPSRHVASGLAMAVIGGAEHTRLGLVMAGVAWLLGISRVAAALHYPSDVLGGAALGVVIGRYIHRS